MWDSSKGAAGLPAYCDGATMTVSPGEGDSTLTYAVPRSWLTSAARVYPVQIDPICYFPNFFPSVDTTVSSGSPNSAFGAATQLNAGYDGTGYWRTLVRFDLTSIPQNSYVEDTDLQLYKSASGGSNGATTVGVMNEAFSGSSTWNSLGCVVNSLPAGFSTTLGSVAGQASGTWNDFWLASVAHAVQRWVSGAQANDGFVLSQDESGAQGAAYLAGYLSQEYGGNDDAPDLWVSYETAPTVTVSCDNTNYRIGATVAVTMRLDSHYASDQWEQQIAINKAGGVQGNYRGLMGLFWFDPNASHADGVSWVTYALGGQYSGSYLAYEAPPGTTYGTQYITPDLAHSSFTSGWNYSQLTFKFAIGTSFGNLQANNFSTYVGMDPDTPAPLVSGSESYLTGWVSDPSYATFNLQPEPVTALSFTTTANTTWWSPAMGNDDTNGQGRGSVTLAWPASPGADGYNIKLWDGYQYDQVATTTATSWTSAGQGLYPTDTQIAAIPSGSTANPFKAGSGLDLRDNPDALYQRMGGTAASKLATAYQFVVVPYNSVSGALATNLNTALAVTLDNRSLPASSGPQNDPQYATYDLGSWDGHDATALLNTGELSSTSQTLPSQATAPMLVSRAATSRLRLPPATSPRAGFTTSSKSSQSQARRPPTPTPNSRATSSHW